MKLVRLAAVRSSRWGMMMAALLAIVPTTCSLHAASKRPKESKAAPKTQSASETGESAQAQSAQPNGAAPVQQKPSPVKDDDLYEGPSSSRPKAVPAPNATAKAAPGAPSGPLYADAWPSEYRKPDADLLLSQSAEGRAQAMAEYIRGLTADKRGDADTALDAWKRAASLDPENSDLAVKVAFELAKRNEPGEAIRVLKDSIAAAPKEARTHIYLAQIYARHLNKPDLALAAAQKAIEVAPEDFQSWAACYDLLQQAGEKKKATELLDKALKSPARNPQYWLLLGRHLQKVFLQENDKPTPDEMRQMEAAFRKASELRPNDASVLAQTGDFFVLSRQSKQALSFYERAVKLNQAPTDEATKNLLEKYADLLIQEGRTTDALPLLEKLSKDTQKSLRSDLYERLGELYEKAGQVDKAVEHFQQTLVLDTVQPSNHYRLANVQLRAKRFDEAVKTIEAARKRFPNDPNTTLMLARVYSFAKRHDEALKTMESAAEEFRGRNEAQLNSTFLEAWATTAERAGKLDKAVELLKKCIADYPDQPGAYNDLGYMWVDRNMNLEEAGELIKKALELDSENAAYLDSLGWYFYRTGKFEDARRELVNALSKLQEDDPTVLDHLADTYEKLGNIKEAIQYWERALKAEPEEPAKIQEKLNAARKKNS